MFETDEPTFFDHFWWYLLQLIFSAPAVTIAGIPVWALLSALHLSSDYQPHRFAGIEALVGLFLGMFAGSWMERRAPLLASSGRWIWLAPAILILPGVLSRQLHPSVVPTLSEYWFGLGALLITLPACSVTGYSVGMALASASRGWAAVQRLTSTQRILVVSGVAVVLCGLLALPLRDFERRSLARWARVRSVIDRDGLQFSPDAKSFCNGQINIQNSTLLRPGTYVESLERRGCNGDQLMAADALPAARVGVAGPYLLDRVRVLDGPNAGSEGWVLEYGLMEH